MSKIGSRYFVSYHSELGRKWKDKIYEAISTIVDVEAIDANKLGHEIPYDPPTYIRDRIQGSTYTTGQSQCVGCNGFIAILMTPENRSNSLPFWPVFEFGIAWGTQIEERFFFFLIDEELKKKWIKKNRTSKTVCRY